MNRETWLYLAQLTRALQLEGVEGRRAGAFVAEIESHLAETGADPVDEFGPPAELAADMASRPGSRRPGWVPPLWSAWLLALVVAAVASAAADALIGGWGDDGIPIRARGMVWVGVLLTLSLIFGYVATRNLDGRSWSALTGGRAVAAIVGIALVTTVLSNVAGDAVLAQVPAPWFWVIAGVSIPLLGYVLVRRNNPVRFPPHAAHLKPLKRGILAGSPPR